jgi:hypothetical protein
MVVTPKAEAVTIVADENIVWDWSTKSLATSANLFLWHTTPFPNTLFLLVIERLGTKSATTMP